MSMEPAAAAREKAAVRDAARRRRRAFDAEARRAASACIVARCLALPAVHAAASAFVYVATASEVDTRAIIDDLQARGCQVLIPSLQHGPMCAVPFPGWAALRPGALGIAAPPPAPAWRGAIDVVLVPGLAFTLAGARLGYGGGHYDRWLAAHAAGAVIALAFERQLLPALPVTALDVPMQYIVTETRVIDCQRPRPGQ